MAESSLFNNWNSVVAPVRNELVFEDRNKTYGAFDLRKNHNRRVALALLITGVTFLLAVSTPAIIAWIKNSVAEVEVPVDITQLDLTPPPLDPTEPPPPPPPPPPVMETVKFTPPVVTDDEVVEDPPPVQTEETPTISTVTQEGDGKDEIIIPEASNGVVEPVIEAPLTIVEQMPTFPGGEGEMMKWITKRIEQKGYPQMEKEAGISGTCYVTFIVERDGSISDVKLLRGVSGGPGYNKIAQDVVKEMPAWKAGKQNGREVRVQFNLPIKFTLR